MSSRAFVLTLVLGWLPSASWAQVRLGSEFQVNVFTTSSQYGPSVAADASGNFVVVWSSDVLDGDNLGVFARRYDATGTPLGAGEFRVNSYTTNGQEGPRVASDTNGDLVVVWNSFQQDGSAFGVFGRRYDPAGAPQGAEFQVNAHTTDQQFLPSVASDANGDFVVAWASKLQDGSLYGIFGQRYDALGAAQGSEFQVNSYTTMNQLFPSVASDANGNFVVAWRSFGQDGDFWGIFGQRYDASGAPRGAEFQVNSYTTSSQVQPSVASDASGNFVVVWMSSPGQDGSGLGVFGQRFDAAGARRGSEFRVNSYTTGNQGYPNVGPSVASDANGNFVVVWMSDGQDGSDFGVFGQLYDASGAPQGGEFQVNSYTTGRQGSPSVASDANGNFVVAWQSNGQDGSGYGVFAQRFAPDLIFKDGFESGNLSAWSTSITDGGDLSVSTAAALKFTTAGLQGVVDDTNGIYVQDDRPNKEIRYHARFYFDPNGFDPGEAQAHFRTRIFIAFDPAGLRLVTLVLKRQTGLYSIEARVRRNDGSRADTGFLPLSDGPHSIEFDWRRATAPGAGDGTLELWIDGSSVATVAGIDNDQRPIDFVRMGALSVKTGAAGTIYWDEFESRRQSYIGP